MEEKESEKTELTEESGAPTGTDPDSATRSTQARKPARKRTKTGCLTCRRRRIKCGEERPICQNCVKSKRECEGYTQRVISRHPLSMLSNPSLFPRGPPDSNQPRIPFDYPYLTSPSRTQPPAQHHNTLLPLAPRPTGFDNGNFGRDTNFAPEVGSHESTQIGSFSFPQQSGVDSPDSSELTVPASNPQQSLGRESAFPQNPTYTPEGFYQGRTYRTVDQMNQLDQLNQDEIHPPLPYTPDQDDERRLMNPIERQPYGHPAQNHMVTPPYPVSADTPVDYNARCTDGPYHGTNGETREPAQMLPDDPGADEYDMVDYYDVESDEELATERSQNLQTILSVSSTGNHHHRSFSTYLNEPNLLTTYRPSPFMSPLMDSKCARIFCHFVASTGPLLSIFERHPINPSVLFSGQPVPLAQQGLWTYTLPMKALEHQGLLHAMLAVASLHISRLQQTSATTSHRHYHFAIRRVAKALGLPQRRRQIETLTATLLLAFYEVITAEHSKWNSHIAGAAQLLKEIDFVGLTRDLRAQRADAEAKRQQAYQTGLWWETSSSGLVSDDDQFAEKEGSIDENFVGKLVGRAIRYDDVGVVESEGLTPPKRFLTAKDIEDFRIQSDLYWWYCKQDIIRSMVSGNPLLLPFDRWGQCPPRAGFGRLDAVYGTMDHLFLLMARICTFGAKDRPRKAKVMEANGGQFRPPPGFFQPPNTSQGSPGSSNRGSYVNPRNISPEDQSSIPSSKSHITQSHTSSNATGPQPSQPRSPESTKSENLEEETLEARAEWSSILAAFEAFAECLGPGFAPLPPDSVQSITTPFGPAVQYRTHTIAFLMAFYFTGRIMLERLQPDMPPAATVAAVITASRTAKYAQFIGKIAAGLYYPQQPNLPGEGLSPTLGAALSDITIALFFAGVQFTDAAQRGWTISKLRDIARLSGWQSAAAIAAGCETAWVKAYEAGKGPPYERTMDNQSSDFRISRKPMPDARDQEGRIISRGVEYDRRFITVDEAARVHWATGLLSLENDFGKMGLDHDDNPH